MDKATARWIRWMDFGKRLGCHQMAERSFFVAGYQFPVCARCTGVILGEFLAVLLWILGCKPLWYVSLILLAPMGIDWGLQHLKILMSDNIRRVITGTIAGIALTNLYADIFIFLYQCICNLF